MRIIYFFVFIFQFFISAYALNYTINTDFFTRFNDEKFEKYIYESLSNNHDLKKADAVVEQYRYDIRNAYAVELPKLSVSSNYLLAHFPRYDDNFFIKENSYILPFQLSYEPDFLLKNKDRINIAKDNYKAQVANQKRTYISLLTDVANAYLNILLFDFLIERQNIIVSNNLFNLKGNAFKFDYGVIDLISFNNIKEDYNSQKIALDNLIKNQKTTINNFCALIGRSAMACEYLERGKLEDFEYQETIPVIINSDLIYKRPDLIELENKLKSAKLDITVARKEFFPRFNISSGIIFDTAGSGNFFSWESSFAYIVAGLTQDIFTGGRKIANLKIKKAKFQELFEQFKQADLNAIKEVSNALVMIEQDKKALETAKRQLDLEISNYKNTTKKLELGVISKIDLVQQNNTLHLKEQLYMASKAQKLGDYFTLYKALGGEL